MISREREREREEKENLSSLKIYARVFLYETTHLSYGDADLRYRVFRPFRCTLYSHSYLLYFTSRRRITSVCFNNEEIKISCVCVVLFFFFLPFSFFSIVFARTGLSRDRRNERRTSKIRSHRRAVKRILRIVLRSFSFTIKERPRRSIYTEYFNAKYNSHPHTNAFKRKNNRSSSSSWEEATTTKSTSTKTKE